MKTLLFLTLILISQQSFASQCQSFFSEELQIAQEGNVFFRATTGSVKDIKPDTRKLLIDEKVEVGDFVYIEFLEAIVGHSAAQTSSARGNMLGTKMMIDPVTREEKVYYFVMDTSNKKFDVVIGFSEDNINYDTSRVEKRQNYHRNTLN